MSNSSVKSSPLSRIVDLLRDPLKLRLVLCPVILGGWYFLFFSPLSDGMTATQRADRQGAKADCRRAPGRPGSQGS